MDRPVNTDGPVEVDLATSLRTFAACAAAQAAAILESGGPRAGTHAASWMRAAREALEGARVAEEPMSDTERAATARLVQSLRDDVDRASAIVRQRDDLALLLNRLAAEFDSGQSPTSTRLAARIRREVYAILPEAERMHERGEAAAEAAR